MFISIKFNIKRCWSCRQSMLCKYFFYVIDMHLINDYNVWFEATVITMCTDTLSWFYKAPWYSNCIKKLLHRPHMSDRHCSIAEKFGMMNKWWFTNLNPSTSLKTFCNSVNPFLSKHHMPPNSLCKADYFWSIKFLKKKQNLNFKGFNFKRCKFLVDFKPMKIHVTNSNTKTNLLMVPVY